ncbi:hypothetical protein AXFE_25860 [Acidithrix ferrooxidans]|uniref:Uncharacterized protein n=1 Tax=Acidithrix ferrooxidans TaxID=1280514 RepID=A0A0D8HF24_9ACTN|nr:hypothetical protein AXFE_25860 [Acidithrix ferrooxidans]
MTPPLLVFGCSSWSGVGDVKTSHELHSWLLIQEPARPDKPRAIGSEFWENFLVGGMIFLESGCMFWEGLCLKRLCIRWCHRVFEFPVQTAPLTHSF